MVLNTIEEDRIKSKGAYKETEGRESPYQHYLFWNKTFGKYYGEVGEPPYSSFNVKLAIDNKTDMKEWLDSFENQDLANDIRQDLAERGKEVIGTISIPYEMFISKPIPKEISSFVDVRTLISNICSPYYIGFEAVGMFFLNNDVTKLISDLY